MTSPIFPCFLRLSWIYWFLYLQELPADFIGSTVSLSLAPEFYGPIPDSRDSLDSLLQLHSAQTTIAFLHFHLWTRCLFEDSTYKFHRHKLEFCRSFANHTLLLEFYVCLQPLCSCCLAALRYFFWFPALVSEIEKGRKTCLQHERAWEVFETGTLVWMIWRVVRVWDAMITETKQ